MPILALTFHSARYDHLTLRRLVAQVDDAVKQVPLVAETTIIGGAQRQVRVLLDPGRGWPRAISAPPDSCRCCSRPTASIVAGGLTSNNREVIVETGAFPDQRARTWATWWSACFGGKPVYLRDVADIVDGAEEPIQYVFFGARRGAAGASDGRMNKPAVTLSIAKRPGANAISVADEVLQESRHAQGPHHPERRRGHHHAQLRRDGGGKIQRTAAAHGHRGGRRVAAHPADAGLARVGHRGASPSRPRSALTLLVFYLYGYTLNRITLFALIFSIGILVDDAIVVVENIVRHFHLPQNKGRNWSAIAVEAVNEVGNPTILATFAVIAAVLPMAFVGGLMGPYMRPIPIGSSAAMFFSLAIAFIVTPWARIRILRWGRKYSAPDRRRGACAEGGKPHLTSSTRKISSPDLPPRHGAADRQRELALAFSRPSIVVLAAGGDGAGRHRLGEGEDAAVRQQERVPDHPQHARRQRARTHRAGRARNRRRRPHRTGGDGLPDLRRRRRRRSTSTAWCATTSCAAARTWPTCRSTSCPKASARRRATTSPSASARASRRSPRNSARASPWPKCRPARRCCRRSSPKSTARPKQSRLALARKVIDIFHNTPGVVDTDWYIEADQPKARFVIDKEKAALNGISAETISETLRIAVGGESVDLLHVPREKEDVNIVLQLPRASRTTPEELLALRVRSGDANALPEPAPPHARRWCRCANWCTIEQTIDGQEHLPQEPHARDLRHRRRGGRDRKPGLCDSAK